MTYVWTLARAGYRRTEANPVRHRAQDDITAGPRATVSISGQTMSAAPGRRRAHASQRRSISVSRLSPRWYARYASATPVRKRLA